jgi:hypothetical protein
MLWGDPQVSESAMPRMLKTAEALQIKGLSNVRSKRDTKPDDEGVEDVSDQQQPPQPSDNSNGNNSGNRRSTGHNPSDVSERPSAVPLHRRRKRARTASYDTAEV